MQQLSVRQLKAHLDAASEAPQLLDVREAWEVRLCVLAGSLHIPMNQIPGRLEELDRARQTIVICHHGVRSHRVAHFLEHQGFANVCNLSGGIDAWAREIDQTLATY